MSALAAEGRDAVVWGAGSKGATFVNLFQASGALSRVVDVNPHKAGMRMSGTGHPIVPPDRLLEGGAPDLVILMNPIYREEVQGTLDALEIRSELLDA